MEALQIARTQRVLSESLLYSQSEVFLRTWSYTYILFFFDIFVVCRLPYPFFFNDELLLFSAPWQRWRTKCFFGFTSGDEWDDHCCPEHFLRCHRDSTKLPTVSKLSTSESKTRCLHVHHLPSLTIDPCLASIWFVRSCVMACEPQVAMETEADALAEAERDWKGWAMGLSRKPHRQMIMVDRNPICIIVGITWDYYQAVCILLHH